jgi:hypothetical protein
VKSKVARGKCWIDCEGWSGDMAAASSCLYFHLLVIGEVWIPGSDGGSKACGSATVTDTYSWNNVKFVFIRCPEEVGDNFFKCVTDLFIGRCIKKEERLNRQYY